MKTQLLTLSTAFFFTQALAQTANQGEVPLDILQAFSEEPTIVNQPTPQTNLGGFIIEETPTTTSTTNTVANNIIDDNATEQFVNNPNTPAPVEQISTIINPVIATPNIIAPHESVAPLTTSATLTASSSTVIASQLTSSRLTWHGKKVRLRSLSDTQKLYNTLGDSPIWTQDGKITKLAGNLIGATNKAWEHALNPKIYHSALTNNLSVGDTVDDYAKFDVILSDAFITYKKHLANGIVPPKKQFNTWNQGREHFDYAKLYRDAERRGTVKHILKVNNRDYQILKKAYVSAGAPRASSEPLIPSKTMRLGSKGKSVVSLRKRLGLSTKSDKYNDIVKQAVKDYQKSNRLSADGIAGRGTIAHMNGKSGSKRNARKLALNMERLRWQKGTPSGSYIWVNIPAYKMAIRNGDKYVFESNVIVGRKERQTPVFSDTLEHVVLAPYWNVPKTIFKEDKLPKLQKNPNALGKDMEAVNNATGKVANFSTIDWKKGGEGYRLRQLPGPRNSLGYMKFLFPNHHAIYLHDTPNRKLFKKRSRAFSSGCVRVERAQDLAVHLLKSMGYNSKRVIKESRKKKEKWITLSRKLRYPVFLNYYTAWADKSGKVHYSKDIYGYDKALDVLYKSKLKKI